MKQVYQSVAEAKAAGCVWPQMPQMVIKGVIYDVADDGRGGFIAKWVDVVIGYSHPIRIAPRRLCHVFFEDEFPTIV